jgi:cysteine synthase A
MTSAITTGRAAIADSVLELIGHTPLVRLARFGADSEAELVAKLEMFNPASSVKDRIALDMVEDAERQGLIVPGRTTIIEPTSGNTGIGLALVARIKGYACTVVMPDSMSIERRHILRAFGAEIVLTPAVEGFQGTIGKVYELLEMLPDAWSPLQFDNPANPGIHRDTTGKEIWEGMAGRVDAFICGIGTGGTLSGVGEYLKALNPAVHIVAVEPEGCALLSGGSPGPHKIQGLNAGFIAKTTNTSIIDDVLVVSADHAMATARLLALKEGLFVGISSGAAAWGALQLAKRPEFAGKRIVTLFPDTGERYLSTELWNENE